MATATAHPPVMTSTHQQPYYPQTAGVSFTPSAATATTTPPMPLSPSQESPTSPRSISTPSHLKQPSRQLRPPKQPLYVPAVLRPTEKPVRNSPPKNGEPVSAGTGEMMDGRQRPTTTPATPGTVSRVMSDEWNDEVLGDVTGPPSRNHWKPDPASHNCDSPLCSTAFSFFIRRHHCRRCGNIFCAQHSQNAIPLDQHARFHPQAERFRACDTCNADYRTWETARLSRSNSDASLDEPRTPVIGIRGARGHLGVEPRVGSVSSSAPRDWNWSTF